MTFSENIARKHVREKLIIGASAQALLPNDNHLRFIAGIAANRSSPNLTKTTE